MEKQIYRKHIITINSLFSDYIFGNSGKFSVPLYRRIKNIIEIKLINGHIPEITHPYLYINIEEIKKYNVTSNGQANYQFILRKPNQPAISGLHYLNNLIDTKNGFTGKLGYLSRFTIQFYDMFDNKFNFGNSKLTVLSFSNAALSEITTSINHGLALGDALLIRNFKNASSDGVRQTIENTRAIIQNITAVNRFTVNLDLSGEMASQQNTGTAPPYVLGSKSTITSLNDYIPVSTFTTDPSGTIVTTSINHNLILGITISISGCDNCVTEPDNERINKKHVITNIIDPTHFLIGAKLISYASPNQKTNIQASYLLGANSILYIEKYQSSFDFELTESI